MEGIGGFDLPTSCCRILAAGAKATQATIPYYTNMQFLVDQHAHTYIWLHPMCQRVPMGLRAHIFDWGWGGSYGFRWTPIHLGPMLMERLGFRGHSYLGLGCLKPNLKHIVNAAGGSSGFEGWAGADFLICSRQRRERCRERPRQ